MEKNSKLAKTVIASSVLCASVASIFALKRYFVLKDLKEELGSIPWEKKEVTWKHFFKSY